MHHQIEHNNMSNNNTIDTDMEQTEMNSNINYIKSKENCTGNNPWATDMMDDVQEGTNRNGDESANYLSLLTGDEVPVKVPEWIIHLPGMNEDDMRIIILWLLLDPPSPDDSEETAIRLLMSEAKQYHGDNDNDLHDRLNLIMLESRYSR